LRAIAESITKLGDGLIPEGSCPAIVNGKCIQGLGSHGCGCAVEDGKKKTYDLPMATENIQMSSGESLRRAGVGEEAAGGTR
jgi:hypothetical protein